MASMDLDIDVNADINLNVSFETAEMCAKLLEIYFKNNLDMTLHKWVDEKENRRMSVVPQDYPNNGNHSVG